jgi:hypothetical protein
MTLFYDFFFSVFLFNTLFFHFTPNNGYKIKERSQIGNYTILLLTYSSYINVGMESNHLSCLERTISKLTHKF